MLIVIYAVLYLSCLVYCFAQLLEMGDKLLVILSLMDVETVPQVTADYHTAKAEVAHLSDIVQVDASHCVDFLVDKSL